MARVYGGRWKTIDSSLPEGGQAHVCLVHDITGEHAGEWVLKRLKNPRRLGRFQREIQALQELSSPRIPRVIDWSLSEPAYLVCERLGDENLERYCRNHTLTLDQGLSLFRQVVEAVSHAHQKGIPHRDIKPNNVSVSADGREAFLLDFGICQFVDDDLLLTTTDEPLGSALFAAPECMPGGGAKPGAHSDIYSLGKLLYWMVADGSRHVHREEISEPVIDRIKHESGLVRFHVGRLLHGTIIENPAQRWTAAHLLQKIVDVQKKIEELERRKQDGEVVLWDGFGLDNSFNAFTSKSITTPPQGNPPGDYDQALPFAVSGESDVLLDSVALAVCSKTVGAEIVFLGHDRKDEPSTVIDVSSKATGNQLEILACQDRDGSPDDDRVVDSLVVQVPGSQGVVSARSTSRPRLKAGHTYWLVLSALEENSRIVLFSSPQDFRPRRCTFARRANLGAWEVAESKSGPGFAYRVVGAGTG